MKPRSRGRKDAPIELLSSHLRTGDVGSAGCGGHTAVDVLVSLVVIVVVLGAVLPGLRHRWGRQGAPRIHCVNNLKNVGLAFRIFATDNDDRFPYELEEQSGGTRPSRMEPPALWKQFLVLSNELSIPKLLACPDDRARPPISQWTEFTNNQHLSYHLGVETLAGRPDLVLSGDRNVSLSGVPLENMTVNLGSDSRIAFDRRLHRECGNVLMSDGSVQQSTSRRLREIIGGASRAASNVVLVIP